MCKLSLPRRSFSLVTLASRLSDQENFSIVIKVSIFVSLFEDASSGKTLTAPVQKHLKAPLDKVLL